MDMEAYKQKAIVLLGEYHKREAQVKLLKIEYQALEQLAKIQRQITWLELQNKKVDVILESLSEPYQSLLKWKYIELLPWVMVYQRCAGYSEDYVKKELNAKSLLMFISLYYPETNQVGLFAEGCRSDNR